MSALESVLRSAIATFMKLISKSLQLTINEFFFSRQIEAQQSEDKILIVLMSFINTWFLAMVFLIVSRLRAISRYQNK